MASRSSVYADHRIRQIAMICGFSGVQDGVAERFRSTRRSMSLTERSPPTDRWIAYITDESGKDEVWVASFPAGDEPAASIQWRRNVAAVGCGSKEIVYISGDKQLMASPLHAEEQRREGRFAERSVPHRYLIESDRLVWPTSNAYVATSNGQRFLVAVSAADPDAPPISVIVNWPALLTADGHARTIRALGTCFVGPARCFRLSSSPVTTSLRASA